MIKASVYNGETLTNAGTFETQELAELWVAEHQFQNVVYEDITAKLEQDRINAESLTYLASTDWYVIRKQETGAEIPQDVLEQRAAARARIIK